MAEFTLRQLQYFVAAVEEGSITAAAEANHVTQAAVSMAVSELERALGVSLFVRSHAKRVLPTPAGYALLRYAQQIGALSEEAALAVRQEQQSLSGPVRVGCTATLSALLIPELITHCAEHYPALEFSFVEGSAVELGPDVENGRLDVLLCYEAQRPSFLDQKVLREIRQHVAVAADHPLADQPSVRLEQLMDEPLILFDIPPTVDRVLGLFHSLGFRPNLRWRSKVLETLLSMVGRGFAWSYFNTVPRWNYGPEAEAVRFVPIADELPANPIVAAVPQGVQLPRRIQVVLEHLASSDWR
ncbi:LysR family transcriptional regulator [Micrococcoides hystricis]|uniref:LysR family transcriptional regulator n=1 Tax=Micrococcoides hystricis TaxID=1572761 RepID=A0ABV6PCR3_9MICC